MEAQRSEQKNGEAYKRAKCPKCGKPVTFMTKREIDYTQHESDCRARCLNCDIWVYFSLK